ncbi:MAG: hypothetical protein ACYDAB_07075 [bacterium]
MISEDEAMELAWALHPELRAADDEGAEAEPGVNWRLHLTLDAIVLRRMSDATLPDARVVPGWQPRGMARGDAVHQIAAILAEAIWHIGTRSRKAGADPLRDAHGMEGGALSGAINATINALV